MDEKEQQDENNDDEQGNNNKNNNLNTSGSYETAVCTFLQLYLGNNLGKAFNATIPPAPPRTLPRHRTLQVKNGAHKL